MKYVESMNPYCIISTSLKYLAMNISSVVDCLRMPRVGWPSFNLGDGSRELPDNTLTLMILKGQCDLKSLDIIKTQLYHHPTNYLQNFGLTLRMKRSPLTSRYCYLVTLSLGWL